jgi:hypothetical protein
MTPSRAAPSGLRPSLKRFVDAGIMKRAPLPEHSTRYEYVLTEKGLDFLPAYLALKRWGDDWLAEPEGPQVIFRDRVAGRAIEHPKLLAASRCAWTMSRSLQLGGGRVQLRAVWRRCSQCPPGRAADPLTPRKQVAAARAERLGPPKARIMISTAPPEIVEDRSGCERIHGVDRHVHQRAAALGRGVNGQVLHRAAFDVVEHPRQLHEWLPP